MLTVLLPVCNAFANDAFSPNLVTHEMSSQCPDGYRPVTKSEAQQNHQFFVNQMGKWQITSLYDSWVIMGSGYNGTIKRGTAGNTFCYPGPTPDPEGVQVVSDTSVPHSEPLMIYGWNENTRNEIKALTISTNPTASFIPNYKSNASLGTDNDYQSNTFNWKEKYWQVAEYTASSNPMISQVLSPFFQHALNRYPFSKPSSGEGSPDFLTEQGWELIQSNLGFSMKKEGIDQKVREQKTYGYPYVMLYNKNSGILRIVALYNHSPSIYNTAAITLEQSSESNMVANNLFAPYTQQTLSNSSESSRRGKSITSLVKLISNEDKQWIFADFTMGYDPCISCYESALKLSISPIASGETSLTGRSTGISIPVRDAQGLVDSDYLIGGLDGLNNNIGAVTFQSYQDLYNEFKDHKDYASVVYEEKSGASSSEVRTGLKKTGEALSAINAANPEPISKAIIGFVAGIFDFANFGTPPKIEGIELPPPMPTVAVGELALSGTVTFTGHSDVISIAAPGSLSSNNKPELQTSEDASYAVYNEPLGLFSIVEVDNERRDVGPQANCAADPIRNHIPCTMFEHGLGFYYTINPRSGLNPKDVDVYVTIDWYDESGSRLIESKTTTIEDLLSQFRGAQSYQKATSVKFTFVKTDATGSKSGLSVDSNVLQIITAQTVLAKDREKLPNAGHRFVRSARPIGAATTLPGKPFFVYPHELTQLCLSRYN